MDSNSEDFSGSSGSYVSEEEEERPTTRAHRAEPSFPPLPSSVTLPQRSELSRILSSIRTEVNNTNLTAAMVEDMIAANIKRHAAARRDSDTLTAKEEARIAFAYVNDSFRSDAYPLNLVMRLLTLEKKLRTPNENAACTCDDFLRQPFNGKGFPNSAGEAAAWAQQHTTLQHNNISVENWEENYERLRAIAKVLILSGAHVNVADAFEGTPILTAAKLGDVELLRLMLQGNGDEADGEEARRRRTPPAPTSINEPSGRFNLTPLEAACSNGHTMAVELLLDCRCNVKARIDTKNSGGGKGNSKNQFTTGYRTQKGLNFATAVSSGSVALCRRLVEEATEAKKASAANNNNSFHSAKGNKGKGGAGASRGKGKGGSNNVCFQDPEEISKELLSEVEISATKALLEQARDDDGRMPLVCACGLRGPQGTAMLTFLLSLPACAAVSSPHAFKAFTGGQNLFLTAATAGSSAAMKFLVELARTSAASNNEEKKEWGKRDTQGSILSDISPTVVDSKGRTALHLAAAAGGVEAMQYAISLGIDVNVADPQGKTPLHLAEDAAAIAFLLEQPKINPNALDVYGGSVVTKYARVANTPKAKAATALLLPRMTPEALGQRQQNATDVYEQPKRKANNPLSYRDVAPVLLQAVDRSCPGSGDYAFAKALLRHGCPPTSYGIIKDNRYVPYSLDSCGARRSAFSEVTDFRRAQAKVWPEDVRARPPPLDATLDEELIDLFIEKGAAEAEPLVYLRYLLQRTIAKADVEGLKALLEDPRHAAALGQYMYAEPTACTSSNPKARREQIGPGTRVVDSGLLFALRGLYYMHIDKNKADDHREKMYDMVKVLLDTGRADPNAEDVPDGLELLKASYPFTYSSTDLCTALSLACARPRNCFLKIVELLLQRGACRLPVSPFLCARTGAFALARLLVGPAGTYDAASGAPIEQRVPPPPYPLANHPSLRPFKRLRANGTSSDPFVAYPTSDLMVLLREVSSMLEEAETIQHTRHKRAQRRALGIVSSTFGVENDGSDGEEVEEEASSESSSEGDYQFNSRFTYGTGSFQPEYMSSKRVEESRKSLISLAKQVLAIINHRAALKLSTETNKKIKSRNSETSQKKEKNKTPKGGAAKNNKNTRREDDNNDDDDADAVEKALQDPTRCLNWSFANLPSISDDCSTVFRFLYANGMAADFGTAVVGDPALLEHLGSHPLIFLFNSYHRVECKRRCRALYNILRTALDNGVDPNGEYDPISGDTPLILATKLYTAHWPRIIRLLIRNGADITATNDEGETALDIFNSFVREKDLTDPQSAPYKVLSALSPSDKRLVTSSSDPNKNKCTTSAKTATDIDKYTDENDCSSLGTHDDDESNVSDEWDEDDDDDDDDDADDSYYDYDTYDESGYDYDTDSMYNSD